jgi:NAD/NADP transhydrogenase beta subunit
MPEEIFRTLSIIAVGVGVRLVIGVEWNEMPVCVNLMGSCVCELNEDEARCSEGVAP